MVELIFIHLPKTGGSSILETLLEIYGEECVRHFERDECLRLNESAVKISEVISKDTKVIHGHFLYKEIEDIINSDSPRLVTFMRDPIERVISNFHWWKHTLKMNPAHPAKNRENESLEVYITQPEVQNKMARFLEGSQLKEFFFIGFLESFELDLIRLGELLGWPKAPVFHEKDRRTERTLADSYQKEEFKDIIRDLNQDDMQLYIAAQNRFKS